MNRIKNENSAWTNQNGVIFIACACETLKKKLHFYLELTAIVCDHSQPL